MRALVTGATGLVGRQVVDRLLGGGSRVRILTRGLIPLPQSWGGRVEVVVGDVADPTVVATAAADVDIVHHLAGELRRPEQFRHTNVEGTRSVLEVSSRTRIGVIVHYSSVGVFGPVKGRIDESAPCRPASEYERTKYQAERLALDIGRTGRIAVTVLRPSNVFGEGRADSMLEWFAAIRQGWFRRVGVGAVANYIYAGDVADAGIALSSRPDAAGQVFIVSDPTSMDEFVDMMAEAIGTRVPTGRIPPAAAMAAAGAASAVARVAGRRIIPLTMARVRALTTRALYSPERLWHLGIRPKIGLREGLRRTVAWLRHEGMLG